MRCRTFKVMSYGEIIGVACCKYVDLEGDLSIIATKIDDRS